MHSTHPLNATLFSHAAAAFSRMVRAHFRLQRLPEYSEGNLPKLAFGPKALQQHQEALASSSRFPSAHQCTTQCQFCETPK